MTATTLRRIVRAARTSDVSAAWILAEIAANFADATQGYLAAGFNYSKMFLAAFGFAFLLNVATEALRKDDHSEHTPEHRPAWVAQACPQDSEKKRPIACFVPDPI